jgi:hypothetical protein
VDQDGDLGSIDNENADGNVLIDANSNSDDKSDVYSPKDNLIDDSWDSEYSQYSESSEISDMVASS